MQTEIKYNGIGLDVEYEFYAGENRNHGHMDSRLPDVAPQVEILTLSHNGEDITDIVDWVVFQDLEKRLLSDILSGGSDD